MSYSRWGTNSCWYVWWQNRNNCNELAFWYCSIGKNDADDFEVITFKFEEITKNLKQVLEKLKKHTKCSAKNLQKARKYIKEFIKDIEAAESQP